MQRLHLNGTWELTYCGFDWKIDIRRLSSRSGGRYGGEVAWWAAEVPGDAHLDLVRAGFIDDPFFGRNTDHCLWMEGKDWWYRRFFRVPAEFQGRALYLRFAGLDTFATVYLNDERVGEHENMFTPLEIDVSKKVRWDGENVLLVKLASPLWSASHDIRSERCTIEAPQQFRSGVCTNEPPNVYTRKAAMSYGWDVAPRLLTIGIWKEVELLAYEDARIEDVWLRTRSADECTAEVECTVEVRREGAGPVDCTLAAVLGELRSTRAVRLTEPRQAVVFRFTVDRPRLWWPNGYGEPHLYPVQVVLASGGHPIDERSMEFGIRTLELVQEPQPDNATSFHVKVNGRRIFAQGFNWTAPDSIFARLDEARYDELLTLVRESGANMLRVIGIGIYEKEPFYRLCDRRGILLWHDFMLTNFMYPQSDRAFMANLLEEVRFVVRDLRSHPCLALWCGDNESDMRWRDWTRDSFHAINRGLIPLALAELDPDRPYWPSSPYSPTRDRDGHQRSSGDDHWYAPGKSWRESAPVQPRVPRFVTEIGAYGCPSREVLARYLREDEMWPTDSRAWKHHACDTRMAGNWGNVAALHETIRANGKPEPANIDEFIQYSQEVQAETLVGWFETLRASPECGGFLVFELCDCWPQLSPALIGWPCAPKKALAAIGVAFRKNLHAHHE